MKKILLALFIALGILNLHAQKTPCDDERYSTKLFTEIDSVKGVTFGENTSQFGFPRTLKMDVYMPANDALEERPVIILAFGGSFVLGNKRDLQPLCIEYASRGFVAVTVDYRLYDNIFVPIDSIIAYDVVIEAVSDMRASIRKMREIAKDGNPYAIDTNLIFIGGVSSGAITANHIAYLNDADNMSVVIDSIVQSNGGINGNSSDNFQFSSKVSGVLNFSGALGKAEWISEGEAPLFSVHEEFDPTVPFGTGVTTSLGTPIQISGSGAMHPIAEARNVKNQLFFIEGSNGHVAYFANGSQTAIYTEIIDSTVSFLKEIMCDFPAGTESFNSTNDLSIFPNPSNGIVSINGGLEGNASFTIFDLLGRKSMEGTVVQNQSIDLRSLPNGLYLLSLSFDGNVVTKKIILE